MGQVATKISQLTFNIPSFDLQQFSPDEVQRKLEARRKLLESLQQEYDELDRSVSRKIPEIDLQNRLEKADGIAVASALPEGGTLIEFVRSNILNFKAVLAEGDSKWNPARYLAFILPARKPEKVTMIDLGEAEPIDSLIPLLRKSIAGERDVVVVNSKEDNWETISSAIAPKIVRSSRTLSQAKPAFISLSGWGA